MGEGGEGGGGGGGERNFGDSLQICYSLTHRLLVVPEISIFIATN